MSLNPIEIEMMRNALTSVCDEMYVAIMRSAYSTNIKERKDHSTAIFDARGISLYGSHDSSLSV
ncbi:hydantoinase B/oxoprolinase family protein [Cupriavidus taiwanensis]|uniref:hydantoinase B/oxoprolinase family protein n=2 Tax=Cupriavidus taiwanensis TaxID=164546 RepID=UPI000E202F8E